MLLGVQVTDAVKIMARIAELEKQRNDAQDRVETLELNQLELNTDYYRRDFCRRLFVENVQFVGTGGGDPSSEEWAELWAWTRDAWNAKPEDL